MEGPHKFLNQNEYADQNKLTLRDSAHVLPTSQAVRCGRYVGTSIYEDMGGRHMHFSETIR